MRTSVLARCLALSLLVATITGCAMTDVTDPSAWQRHGPGMMGTQPQSAGPDESSFIAGTASAPRVVRIIAGPGLRFTPADVRVAAGETITFEVTTMGPSVHEFKVGRLEDVVADAGSAPEIAAIGMMQTKSLTYAFAGSGPFGFACHEPGHFEAGMSGTITVVG